MYAAAMPMCGIMLLLCNMAEGTRTTTSFLCVIYVIQRFILISVT
jgi:hypothetical protein